VTHALAVASSSHQNNGAVVGKQLNSSRRKESARSNSASRASNGVCISNAAAATEAAVREDALEQMFVASRSKFLAMAHSILQNREDAEEAIQEAFLSAHCHLRSFEGRSALKTWLTRIVLNSALMMRRKRKPVTIKSLSETDGSSEEGWTESIPDLHPSPEALHAEHETFQFIDRVLEKMKPALRQAFTMTYYEDLSGAEASARLRVSCGTFKARLFRARRQVLDKTKRSRVTLVDKIPTRSTESWKRTGLQRFQGSVLKTTACAMEF
jgi:RNA polymerase sigma-70 factor, ECF subfamily